MATAKKPNKDGDYEKLAQLLGNIYENGYLSRKRLYAMSFLKGLIGGLGGVIGATIVVALLIWLFSILGEVPLIGRLFENLKDTVESR